MGANAQTSVPTFTAGDVLTAANMNISARTGVPVFADTTARDAAFGGTGEKTLAEGQLCYVENLTGVAQLQYYDGSTWNSLTAGGLVYITGATFTNVTSVSAPNGTFSSTYRNYLILVNFTAVASSMAFRMRMRASGTDTTTNYFTMATGVNSNGGGANSTANNINFWYLGDMLNAGANVSSAAITLFAPQVAIATSGTFVTQGEDTSVGAIGRAGGLMMNVTTQFDSFTLLNTATANMTGNYRVYGYADS